MQKDIFSGLKLDNGEPIYTQEYIQSLRDNDKKHPDAPRVGRSFPVYLVPIDGHSCEVAFARRERKTGAGYRGFDVAFSPEVTIEEDLYRRDTTMNSMARELPDGKLLDPYGGREDIAQHRVRAVSEHFTEDPVRALRAARQAALFDFAITVTIWAISCMCAVNTVSAIFMTAVM